MELSPIPGLRAYTAVKATPGDFQLSALADVDEMAAAGSSTRSRTRKQAAGAEEMEADDLVIADETADPSNDVRGRSVNVFV
jgi:hypothetical protein